MTCLSCSTMKDLSTEANNVSKHHIHMGEACPVSSYIGHPIATWFHMPTGRLFHKEMKRSKCLAIEPSLSEWSATIVMVKW